MTIRAILDAVARRHADRPMAWVAGATLRYADALRFADAAGVLATPGRCTVVIAEKALGAYAALWASVRGGGTHVPLSPRWNAARVEGILARLRPDAVACSPRWAESQPELLERQGYAPAGALPAVGDEAPLALFANAGTPGRLLADYRARTGAEDLAYVMFTSGSTGEPKGVPIHRAGLGGYVEAITGTFDIGEGELWTQIPDLNFDLSVHDLLGAWATAGCLVAIPAEQAPLAPRLVRRMEIRNWTSVPSAIGRSLSLGLAEPGALPSVRHSFFCGEALPVDTAARWAAACPNGRLINLYGPTEATVAFTWHAFEPGAETGRLVPIGRGLPHCEVSLSPDSEILLAGRQVFAGYLDPPAGAASPLVAGEDGRPLYRTGDLGALDPDGTIHFRGRRDLQVKIRGFRVEIEEVEHALRAASGRGLAAAVPVDEVALGTFGALHAFVEEGADLAAVAARMGEALPPYLTPRGYTALAEFPRTASGKIDRARLRRLAEEAP